MPQSQYEKHLFQHLPLTIAMQCLTAVDCGMVTLKAFHFVKKKKKKLYKNEIALSNCICAGPRRTLSEIMPTRFCFVLSANRVGFQTITNTVHCHKTESRLRSTCCVVIHKTSTMFPQNSKNRA